MYTVGSLQARCGGSGDLDVKEQALKTANHGCTTVKQVALGGSGEKEVFRIGPV